MEIIIGKTAGFCYGVKRAVEGSKSLSDNNSTNKIYCLGELVHNREVIKDLEERGIEFIENISEIDTGTVIVRAHGIEKNIYIEADKKSIEIVDYTCPSVLKIHKIAEEYEKSGYYIFLTGEENHPEVVGTISHCGKEYSLISSEEDIDLAIEKLIKSGREKLLIISQTTFNMNKFEVITKIVQNKTPKNIKIVIENTICTATEIRQKETEDLSKKVDMMIIIGGKKSSNTKKLYDIAVANCNKAICIETKDEMRKYSNEYTKDMKIGIMAGASTPQKSIDEVIEELQKSIIVYQ